MGGSSIGVGGIGIGVVGDRQGYGGMLLLSWISGGGGVVVVSLLLLLLIKGDDDFIREPKRGMRIRGDREVEEEGLRGSGIAGKVGVGV